MKDLEKQIEEAANKKYKAVYDCLGDDHNYFERLAFKVGAKSQEAKEYWQQGMYSEEEVIALTNQSFLNGVKDIGTEAHYEWLRQNKKNSQDLNIIKDENH